MITLFIGRFQPLHLGHCSVIQQLQTEGHEVIIGLGSSQYSGTDSNPLSAEERKWCIQQVFPGIKIVELPDIHDDANWVAHVQSILYTAATSIDQVISGNTNVLELFQAANVPTQPVTKAIDINGTQLRKFIRDHNPIWKEYVPTAIQTYVEQRIT